MYSSKTGRIIIHVTGWLLFFSLIVGFVSVSPAGRNTLPDVFSLPYLFFFSLYITLFYLNVGFLIPQLYLRNKYALYFTIVALLFVVVNLLHPFEWLIHANKTPFEPPQGHPRPPFIPDMPRDPGFRHGRREPHIDIVGIVLFVTFWSLGMAIEIVKQWRNTEQRATRAEAENLVLNC